MVSASSRGLSKCGVCPPGTSFTSVPSLAASQLAASRPLAGHGPAPGVFGGVGSAVGSQRRGSCAAEHRPWCRAHSLAESGAEAGAHGRQRAHSALSAATAAVVRMGDHGRRSFRGRAGGMRTARFQLDHGRSAGRLHGPVPSRLRTASRCGPEMSSSEGSTAC